MVAESRTENTDVSQPILRRHLEKTPWEFSFFQVMRWLHRMEPGRGKIGRFSPPRREVVRFHAHALMAFPASEIQALEWKEEQPVSMTVNFMGMFGPLGAMPTYYTEYIRARIRAKDTTLAAFLDIFNHRVISLFYQAWERYRFYVAYERGEQDRMSRYLLDLIGMGTKGLQKRLQVRDDVMLFFSGLLSLTPRSTMGLEQLLGDYFDVPVSVDQFAGAWFPLARTSQCQFERGDSYSEQLGVGAIVGDEVWDPQSGIRVRVGPLTLRQYLDFLPDGAAYRPLESLVKFYTNGELSFEVQLVLKREETPGCSLGDSGEGGPRLGWVTWAKTADMERDPDEAILRI